MKITETFYLPRENKLTIVCQEDNTATLTRLSDSVGGSSISQTSILAGTTVEKGPYPTGRNFILAKTSEGGVTYSYAPSLDFNSEDFIIEIIDNDLTITGHVDIIHTATETDDHALEISIFAEGFGDVKALDIFYDTGVLTDGNDESVTLVSLDQNQATGGSIVGLEVLATQGDAHVCGALFGAEVNPIMQLSGTFEDADTILVRAVDQTTALSEGGAGNISIFINDDDAIRVGFSTKFEEIEFILDTGAAVAGISPLFEYSTGVSTWASFTPIDGTDMMRHTGVIQWLYSDIPAWATGAGSEYLIRITRRRNNLQTTPIADLIRVSAAIEYLWNLDGNLFINEITTVGQVGIGTITPDSSSILDLTSVTGALLLPRMTTTQRDALTEVAGMVIFNTTTGDFEGYDGVGWLALA